MTDIPLGKLSCRVNIVKNKCGMLHHAGIGIPMWLEQAHDGGDQLQSTC